MEGVDAREVLSLEEKRLFGASVAFIFLSFQLTGYPLYLLFLWLCGAGVIAAYALFRVLPRAPNLLLHLKRPPHLKSKDSGRQEEGADISDDCCGVCGKAGCKRHKSSGRRQPYLNAWDGLMIPCTVDSALSEFLEIVMRRYVYSWHRKLVPEAESFEDHVRVMIRYVAAMLLRRAQRLDVPHMIMHKFLPVAAAHINIYMKARVKLLHDADVHVSTIEAAVMREYGDHLHSAMRGPTGNLRYFRQVVHSVLPLLLPNDMMTSKFMCEFIEELFAAKVCIPTMNTVAKPDFLNKMLLIMFDPYSKLMRMHGPNSKEVTLLSQFINRQAHKSRPLDIPLPELIAPTHQLYAFMQFMKAKDCIHVLNLYLSLDDLKAKINGYLDTKPEKLIAQIQDVYETYMISSSPTCIPLDSGQVDAIASVLEDSSKSSVEKCEHLKSINVFGRLRGYIYHELFTKVYCPQFHNSPQFYALHLSKPKMVEGAIEPTDKKGDRWRQKSNLIKQLKQFFMGSEERGRSEATADDGESPSVGEVTPTNQQLASYKVQIIDVDTRTDGIRPYSLYVILVRTEGENGKLEVVKRRYKEFVGLDSKLRQFLPQISVQLPSKRTFRNLDRTFVEARAKELDAYLQALIAIPGVHQSQILASFLTESSDPALFMPDTVGDKAGKMIKSVPSMLRKDKAYHMDDLLPSLLSDATRPPAQSSSATVAEVTNMINTNRATTEGYLNDAAADESDSETTRFKPWLRPPDLGEPLPIDSVMDILMLVSMTVYEVNPLQLTLLQLAKLLGQDSIETLVYNFVSEKVELMLGETKLVQLIHLLRDNLFFNRNPPRTEDELKELLQVTLNHLIQYPRPLVVSAIGEQRYAKGTAYIVEGLQCRELNKQLFFNLLDIILIELFPELVQPDQQD